MSSTAITVNTFEGFTQHGCPGCGSAIPLEDVEDRRMHGKKSGERRRRVTIECAPCGNKYIARFRWINGNWALIDKIKVEPRVRVFVPVIKGLMTEAKFDRPRGSVKRAFRDAARAAAAEEAAGAAA